MGTPLDATQKRSIEQALDLLARLLECTRDLQLGDYFATEREKIRKELERLRGMLADGRIDIESNRKSVQAETDRNGIHINDTQDMFSMPGDLLLNDCAEGYFNSLWLILGMLFHERYHYDHHTGLWGGGVVAVFHFIGGTPALIVSRLQGKTMRSFLFKEFKAYAWSYSLLNTLLYFLEKICREKPDCIPCCQKHLGALSDAAARQNPWSTYGG